MKNIQRITILFLLFTVYSLLFPKKSYAYLDPGTGSFFIQTLLAVILGSVLAVKIHWKNIKAFFSNLFSKKIKKESAKDE